jgi:hypothetical protein
MHSRDGRPVAVWHNGDWLGWLQKFSVVQQLGIRTLRARTVQEHIDAENHHNPDATVATILQFQGEL